MKNVILKAAVMGALGLMSAQASATGVVNIPSTGFAVGSNTSPYTLCNTSGNYGSDDASLTPPTTSVQNTCAVFPTNQSVAPDNTFSLIASTSRTVVLNDAAHTNNTNVTVATMLDRIWRKASTNECFYGARVRMLNVDYDLNTAGTQYIEFNDFVRGGFSGRSADAGYYYYKTSTGGGGSPFTGLADGVVYRIGRTNDAVQHRADQSNDALAATGYVDQPLTTPTPANSGINGVLAYTTPLAVPTAAEQAAALNADKIDFTTDMNWLDDDGGNSRDSSWMYVKTSCSVATTTTSAGALSFRQTAQEDAPWITINVTGYVPN